MGSRILLSIVVFLLTLNLSSAQVASDYSIQLTASAQKSPAKITLAWKTVTGVTVYTVYKKSKTGTSWGIPIATLTATDSSYTDNSVIVDSTYEYYVQGNGTTVPTGYIYAGINAPAIHNRGILILMVDTIFTDSCSNEIYRLMKDMSGDGWQIIRHDVSRNWNDTVIKNLIKNDYSSHSNVQAILLLGHVPIPYSGDLNPDGHPNHLGAWPADVYYGDVNGTWTDVSINDTSAGYALNKNKPGDGKWDQSYIPSPVELQVGRIDFNNMPSFSKTEVQLMKTYLNRDHLYKMDSIIIKHRGLVDDNFGLATGEPFAASGWRNFSPLVGKNNTQSLDFITTLKDSTYLWAYGCGGGNPTGAGGIGSTSDFTTNNVNGIFTMLFGSYFGDWNYQNDFMRAPLCSNIPALTCCWAGRPQWFFHHMALGESIGYSTRLSQNNTNLYQCSANYLANLVHIALMGDPTLRIDYIKPPSNLSISNVPFNTGAHLSWTASPDTTVIGYYIYRSDSMYGNYKKVSPMLITTVYNDSVGNSNGLKYYMVRPVKLQSTPSGNYYNLGIGITDTVTVSYPMWATNISNKPINISIYPNPVKDKLNIIINSTNNNKASLYVMDEYGRRLFNTSVQLKQGNNNLSIDVSGLIPGLYTISINTDNIINTLKWVK